MATPDTIPTQAPRGSRAWLPSLAIRRPIGTLALTSVVMVLGLLFGGRLPVSLLPEVSYPHLRIVVNYPGVTPEVIEQQVTRVLERNLSATANLAEIHGRASEGRCYVELFFEVGTDIDLALQDAARQLERARAELPAGIDPPRLMKMDPSQAPVYELAFSSTFRSSIALREWIDQRLLPQLLTVPGTGTIEAVGGREREIEVEVDPERMRSYRLTLNDILQALALRNADIASGNLTSPQYDVLARTENRYRDAQAVAATLLRIPGSQQQIRLSDLARVTDSHREQRLFARFNGHDAVQVTIMKQPDANAVEVIEGLKNTLERLRQSGFIPADIAFEAIRDESFFVRAALRSVSTAAILGGILAMLLILLFLGNLRQSFIIGLTLPVAIVGAFLLMYLAGLSLNVMSLGGLALGVGLLIDNGLVVLENIHRHQHQLHRDPDAAAHDGAGEVTSAIVAGTLTNLAAVVPFLLLAGMAALLFRELILSIAFAMVTALVAALSLVPALAALTMRSRTGNARPSAAWFRPVRHGLERLTRGYRQLIPRLIRLRYLVIGLALALLAGSVWLLRGVGTEFLPPVDNGRVTLRFVLPLGTPPEATAEAAVRIEDLIAAMPHVATYYSTAGGYFRGGQLSIRGGMIDLVVQLTPPSQRRGFPAEAWVAQFSRKIRDSQMVFTQQRIRGPRLEGLRTSFVDDDISVGVVGEDLDILEAGAQQVLERLRDLEGMGTVRIANEERIPQVVIRLDEERSADLGITVAETGQIIRAAVDGAIPTQFVSDGYEYNIRVRLPRSLTGTAADLANLPLTDAQGRSVNLGSLARLEPVLGPAHIERRNQVRIVRVNGTVNLNQATVGQVHHRVQEALRDLELPSGYHLLYGGAADAIADANRSLRLAIVLAVFFVFVVMAVQYERISSPLVILTAIPFSIIGVAASIHLSGIALSAPVLLGVVFLVGILVNNAILLVEFARQQETRNKLTAALAMAEAGAARLRPVLMTTLTTIFAMLPLALALGEGSELLQPVALSVIGGLAVGTLLTLVLLPGIYVIADDLGRLARSFPGHRTEGQG